MSGALSAGVTVFFFSLLQVPPHKKDLVPQLTLRPSSGTNVRLEEEGSGDYVYLDFVAYRVSSAGSQVWRWQVNRTILHFLAK